MIEYRSAIVDECGDVVMWCDNMYKRDIQEILDQHPEWRERCIYIGDGEDEWMW